MIYVFSALSRKFHLSPSHVALLAWLKKAKGSVQSWTQGAWHLNLSLGTWRGWGETGGVGVLGGCNLTPQSPPSPHWSFPEWRFPLRHWMESWTAQVRVLGCTPQAYKACACPSLRPKKEPGVSDRDINGLTDGGAYMSEARSWVDTPLCAVERLASHGGRLRSPGEGEGTSYRRNWCQVGSSVTRETSRGARPLPPLW